MGSGLDSTMTVSSVNQPLQLLKQCTLLYQAQYYMRDMPGLALNRGVLDELSVLQAMEFPINVSEMAAYGHIVDMERIAIDILRDGLFHHFKVGLGPNLLNL